jgi:hypothetical protein
VDARDAGFQLQSPLKFFFYKCVQRGAWVEIGAVDEQVHVRSPICENKQQVVVRVSKRDPCKDSVLVLNKR